MERHAKVLHGGVLPWLRPDGKTQVTVRYEDNKPVNIETIVLSAQHTEDVSNKQLREAIVEKIIKPPKAIGPRPIAYSKRNWLQRRL